MIASDGVMSRRPAARAARRLQTATWQKWLIIAAAVIGALLLLRSLRCAGRLAMGLFWFWTHGAWRIF